MNTVASIISRKGASIVSVTSEETVVEALRIMAEKNIGSVVVLEGTRYVGIMTERDYSRKVVLKGKDSNTIKVSEIMTTEFPAVKPEDTVEHCMEIMSNKNIRYMPVFDGGQLTGITSMSDVVKETILHQKETISHLESYIHSNA